MDKQHWYVYKMEYYSLVKINELSSHENPWMNFKCILRNERSHSVWAAYCYDLYDIVEKEKNIATVKDQ